MARVLRPRWLVVATLAVVAAIGALVYHDETDRSEAALEDLGVEQATLARAAALAPRSELSHLAQPGQRVAIVVPPADAAIGASTIPAPIRDAIARGATVVRVSREDAPSLGLPERTAMVGVARTPDGGALAIAASAEHQRDRDRAGRMRVLLSMLLAAAVMTAAAAALWRTQRREAELARELALAEAARARDVELDRLSRAATMAALGSGVAHELATPLGVIVGRAEQLIARLSDDERAEKSARAILEQAQHIDAVVRGLLGLARGAPIALQTTTATALVGDAAALVEHRFARAHVHLVPTITTVPEFRCEPLLFKHALVNLLLNACDASPAKSTVRLDVELHGREVEFVVTDEGEGIAPADAARAVEPFFTTKPAGQGTGLGLAIANEIAKTHRGSLAIAPRTPHGTRASIRIPLEPSAGVPA